MVKIRLMRMGAKKRPSYRVVVADARSPRDGRFIENIGKYSPLTHPSVIEIDEERAIHWLRNGAQPTNAVRNLLVKTGIWDKLQGGSGTPVPPPPEEEPRKAPAAEAAGEGAAEGTGSVGGAPETPGEAAEEPAESPAAGEERRRGEETASAEGPPAGEEPSGAAPEEAPAAEESGEEEAPAAEEAGKREAE